ncbi:Glutamyl-tRNA synthetase [Chytridiales sp. JEL 0842]|nr:Glutamyl-tRNA synthetase [Chytridiales sp. JEL 0842]
MPTPTPAVVRFAPSPTGLLHLGGLRTALFNYLLAKQTNGRFILRIEDTDQSRTVPGAMQQMMDVLKWSGLNYDEGPDKQGPAQPYIQSQRSAIYKEHSDELVKSGHGYRCFCTAERLQRVRELAKKAKSPAGYDRHCRYLKQDEIARKLDSGTPYTIRMKVPEGKTSFTDLVYGQMEFSNRTLDDGILIKSDGLPTYHLANVVDDKLMGITHVIRGEEWIPSTPKHIILYNMFGWNIPKFAHLPLLINRDGSKLSKRNNDVHVESLKEKGYLPEAILNFVALLGWAPTSGQTELQMEELVRQFSLAQVNKSSGVVSYDKLNQLNKYYISCRLQDPVHQKSFVQSFKQYIASSSSSEKADLAKLNNDTYILQVLTAVKERARVLPELNQMAAPFFVDPQYASEDFIKWNKTADQRMIANVVNASVSSFLNVDGNQWTEEGLRVAVNDVAKQLEIPFNEVMKVLRYKLTGTKVGISMAATIQMLGKETVVRRLSS